MKEAFMDPTPPRPLRGQVALVTGASRGIGRAVAVALANAGADVAITARTQEGMRDTAAEIEAAGRRTAVLAGDVTDRERVFQIIAEAQEALGPLDLLVNNAGVGDIGGPTWEADPDRWWEVVSVNVLGPFLFARATVPGMRARGRGRIVNVSSYAGVRPTPGATAYSASKAALMRFSDGLAAELDSDGVQVFAMSPGVVRTDMTAAVPAFQDLPDDAFTPAEVGAELIVRLATGEADALSGLMIHALDDLDTLIADAEPLRAAGRYQLRLFRGLGDHEPA
jgi:NAD(P)-dependent dehydrogenase (short-subunit alcohol dehydrogenase family)